jgi:transcriptional regulator with XRE-family HTH domain
VGDYGGLFRPGESGTLCWLGGDMSKTRDANSTDRHVGAKVRMRRLMLGLSQTKLADGLGLTFQHVQKYEGGINRIGASRLQQIANILKVEPAFFFDGAPGPTVKAGDAKAHAYVTEFMASKNGLALIKAFMAIKDPKLRGRVVGLVEQIAAG